MNHALYRYVSSILNEEEGLASPGDRFDSSLGYTTVHPILFYIVKLEKEQLACVAHTLTSAGNLTFTIGGLEVLKESRRE